MIMFLVASFTTAQITQTTPITHKTGIVDAKGKAVGVVTSTQEVTDFYGSTDTTHQSDVVSISGQYSDSVRINYSSLLTAGTGQVGVTYFIYGDFGDGTTPTLIDSLFTHSQSASKVQGVKTLTTTITYPFLRFAYARLWHESVNSTFRLRLLIQPIKRGY
jgi:hypothetical protein